MDARSAKPLCRVVACDVVIRSNSANSFWEKGKGRDFSAGTKVASNIDSGMHYMQAPTHQLHTIANDAEPDMHVLIVEDEPVSRRALSALVSSRGMQVDAVGSAEEGLRQITHAGLPAVALVDLELPGMNGIDFINQLRDMSDSIFTVLMTAANIETINRLRGGSVVTYFRKPLDIEQLLTLIENQD